MCPAARGTRQDAGWSAHRVATPGAGTEPFGGRCFLVFGPATIAILPRVTSRVRDPETLDGGHWRGYSYPLAPMHKLLCIQGRYVKGNPNYAQRIEQPRTGVD